jgi:hypothetical protein
VVLHNNHFDLRGDTRVITALSIKTFVAALSLLIIAMFIGLAIYVIKD